MRDDKRKCIGIVLLCLVLCSCQKSEAVHSNSTNQSQELAAEQETENAEEKESKEKEPVKDAENVSVKTEKKQEEAPVVTQAAKEEYDGSNPYQGTVKEFEETRPIYDTVTKEEAIEDLTYFYDLLKERHPAWLDGSVSKTDAIKKVYLNSIDHFSDKVTVLEIYQYASRMAAILKDGHTGASIESAARILDIRDQVKEYGMPETIDGISLSDLEQKSQELTSYEMEEYREDRFQCWYMYCESYLALFGVNTQGPVEVTFSNGKKISANFIPWKSNAEHNQPAEEYKPYSYTIDAENNLGIFDLKECIYDINYQKTVDSFFNDVAEKKINNIAVDLRYNGGGDSSVANYFISHLNHKSYKSLTAAIRYGDNLQYFKDNMQQVSLRKDAYDGNVYVLISLNTFSAAMDFGMMIQDNKFGVLVGTKSGNMPHCYIDKLLFQMPHSKIALSISYKIHFRIDPDKPEEPLAADYIVDPDKALDKVYELISEK